MPRSFAEIKAAHQKVQGRYLDSLLKIREAIDLEIDQTKEAITSETRKSMSHDLEYAMRDCLAFDIRTWVLDNC